MEMQSFWIIYICIIFFFIFHLFFREFYDIQNNDLGGPLKFMLCFSTKQIASGQSTSVRVLLIMINIDKSVPFLKAFNFFFFMLIFTFRKCIQFSRRIVINLTKVGELIQPDRFCKCQKKNCVSKHIVIFSGP